MTTKTIKERIHGPALSRAATIDTATIDKDARRVRISFSSELPVLRRSWFDDDWIEVLGHESGEVDLDRANSGAPVLYNHSRWDKSDRLGVIERAWLEGGRGLAEIRISKREDVAGIWRDIEDGILTNVSVGYNIHERTLIKKNDDAPDEYRVTRWSPLEVSMVDIPADHTVGVGRSNDDAANRYTITTMPGQSGQQPEDLTMPDNHSIEPDDTQNRQTQNQVDNVSAIEEAARKKALDQDRKRRQDIAARCATVKARYPWVAEVEARAMAGDMTAEAVSAEILKRIGEDAEPLGSDPQQIRDSRVTITEDQTDKTRAAAVNSMLARSGIRALVTETGELKPLDLAGNPFRGATLLQMAERMLRAKGQNPDGLDKRDLVARAFQTTDDFPILFETAIHKVLLNSYRLTADTWRRFCKVGTVSDFRAHTRYRTGSIGNFDSLNEHGEYVRKSIPDGEKASITASTKGNIIGVTRETVINDDLGALTDLAMSLGRAGARTIESAVYAAMAENSGCGPTLSDGVAMCHADHGNIEATTVGAPSVATFEASRILMASQQDVSGNDYLDLRPSIWLGPIGLGGNARVTNDAQYDPDTASKLQRPNMVRGLVGDIVDTPRMSGNPWFLIADPNEAPVLEVAFLDGEQEPYTETQDGWDVDGAEIKARLDFGVAGIDYRGIVKNNGA